MLKFRILSFVPYIVSIKPVKSRFVIETAGNHLVYAVL